MLKKIIKARYEKKRLVFDGTIGDGFDGGTYLVMSVQDIGNPTRENGILLSPKEVYKMLRFLRKYLKEVIKLEGAGVVDRIFWTKNKE